MRTPFRAHGALPADLSMAHTALTLNALNPDYQNRDRMSWDAVGGKGRKSPGPCWGPIRNTNRRQPSSLTHTC